MSTTLFELRVEGMTDAIPVSAFQAIEKVNHTGSLTATCSVSLRTLEPAPLLHRGATLVVAGCPEGPRSFHGVITRQTELAHGGGELVLESRLAALARTRRWRIFHGLDVVALARTLLDEHHVPFRVQLFDSYAPRPHWAQRGESDLALLQRALEEAGIFFYFDHAQAPGPGATEVLVLGDRVESYATTLKGRGFRCAAAQEQLQPGDERVLLDARAESRARAERVVARRHDFTRPRTPPVHDVVAKGRDVGVDLPSGLIDTHAADHESALPVEREARARLDAERADAETLSATSVMAHLAPGQVIALDDGPAREVEQVVTEIAHEGRTVESAGELSYRARVVFAPATVALRPAPSERAPVQGLDAATVVGPPGKEIHTDEHGRVQVRFRWDDVGEPPTAWLQVAQPWSGAGYGSSWLPRVGSEVLVSYLGGHPDRPIVVGSLHHPLSPSPVRHPHEAHQVGIRTRPTPGGEGASELLFDDLAGSERVSLRSSRQLDLSALGNTSLRTTGATEIVSGQSWTHEVGGSAIAQIGGDLDQSVAGSTRERIGGDQRLEVRGAEQRAVGGSSQESIGGMHMVVVGASRHTSIGVGEIGGDERLSVTRHVHIAAGKELDLRAKDRLSLRCGDSSIVMTPSGIRIHSARVEIHTDERTELSHGARGAVGFAYDGAFAFAAETITLASKAGASLVLDADAKLDGALVMLNCGGASAGGVAPGVVDEDGEAVFVLDPAGLPPGEAHTFVIAAPDGERLEREVLPGGEIRLRGRPGERFALVEVRSQGRRVRTRDRESGEG